jgi:hypothetical protein
MPKLIPILILFIILNLLANYMFKKSKTENDIENKKITFSSYANYKIKLLKQFYFIMLILIFLGLIFELIFYF